MSQSAEVHSTEAIEAVAAGLLRFREQVDQATTGLEAEIRRTIDWLEHDRPRFWKKQLHQAHDGVAQARANLQRCLMFPINDERPSCYEERAALKRAEARLAYCEEKTERVQQWIRDVRREQFDFEGRMGKLKRIVVEDDLPKAIGVLGKLLGRLEEYQQIGANSGGTSAPKHPSKENNSRDHGQRS